MNETIQLLRDVAKNARTGEVAINQLMEKAESAEMRSELDRAREQYRCAARDAETALARSGDGAEGARPDGWPGSGDAGPGAMQRAGMWLGTQMNTLTDRSNAHIAEMVIQGATMGIIEMTRARNTCPDADADAAGLASRFIVDQNDIIDRQKAYLKERVLA